ncbi:hypothetical protein [Methylocella sp.]|uniref:hypothetical protein n=1 Tax=Methylocella sp. TaxID=1978226 RepID=UPI003784B532
MRLRMAGLALAGAAAGALAVCAPAAAQGRGRVSYGPSSGYQTLQGDPESGYGFYALPGGAKGALATVGGHGSSPGAQSYLPPGPPPATYRNNAVRYAETAGAVDDANFVPAGPMSGARQGVFNANDGVGTPFFGGYYATGGGNMSAPGAGSPDLPFDGW